MLRFGSENPERMRIIEKYGQGFDLIYLDGRDDARLEIVKKGILNGGDLEFLSKISGYSIEFLEKIKEDL